MTSAARGDRSCPASAPAPVRAFVSVGSNVQPARHIRRALRQLAERFGPLTVSSVYRNQPAGFEGADFLNLVVSFETREPAPAVVAELERLHAAAGRVRGAEKFAPRPLDLDLLLYGDQVIDGLRVPRNDVTEYSFVLGPLAEIAPGVRHPVSGETMAELWQRFDKAAHPIHRLPFGLP